MALDFLPCSFSCRAACHAAALAGAEGKLERVMFRSSRKTTRLTLSTSVRAVNQITPKVGSLAAAVLTATAAWPSS